MKTPLVVIGGLSLLACSCASDPRVADSRQTPHSRRAAPAIVDSDPDPLQRPPSQDVVDPKVQVVRNHVRSTAQAISSATPVRSAPAETAPDAAAGTPAEWLNPDAFRLSMTPQTQARRATPPPASDETPAPVENGASVANQGTQIARESADANETHAEPRPRAARQASASEQSVPQEPVYPSIQHDVTATVEADPDPMGHRLSQRIRDYPTDLASHVDYQMLRFLRDEQVPQLETLSTLPSEDREVLTALMDGLSNFRSGLRADKNMLLSQKVKPIIDMADRMRAQAELSIPTIAICSRVQGFGVYDPMPTTLRAGVDNTVIIYCEVANFSSQQNDKALWETKLNQEAVLYTEAGYAAWRDKSDIPVDLSRNRRHDFFVVKKVTLPRTLGVGRYVLKVSVVDEQVKRIAENSVSIELMAQ